MEILVKSFGELTKELQILAGGKGGRLANLFQQGYPVPDGFVIFPSAFEGEKLLPCASHLVHTSLQVLRKKHKGAAFAVRSSALGEDSNQASFAGAFETVLGVKTDEEIWGALSTVYRSTRSERVQTYSSVQGLDRPQQMAVVVQLMVPSEMSGILFTADPVTGSYTAIVGNYISGLGEQLVSGEANPFSFQLKRPKGSYDGPDALAPYASRLYRLARKLEREFDGPQDIEWALAKGKLYLLQTRPITTLKAGDLETYDLNYTLIEDALWTNTNVAEAMPDVLSPLTWSIGRQLDEALNFIPGYYIWSGNIAGRAYMNISRRVSVISSLLGRHAGGAIKLISDLYGPLPEGMRMPLHLFSRAEVIRTMVPRLMRLTQKMLGASVHLSRFLKQTPVWCREMRERIQKVKTKEELLSLWKQDLQPTLLSAWLTGAAGASKLVAVMTLDTKLTKLVGTQESNTLLSNLRGGSELASLGPVVGISKVIKGEMSREEYLSRYGHRGPHEYELSIPDPLEDTNWLEQQIEEANKSPLDVEGLLKKQHAHYEEAVMRFHQRYPRKRKWLEKQLAKASQAAHIREELRSEFVRVFRVMRAFARRAGELTGLGNDIFFLYIEEVEELLVGKEGAVKHIPARKANYEKYQALPPLPSLIRGRFDPFEWAKNPHRRNDFYDATLPIVDIAAAQTLEGYAGAAGRVEGTVRILVKPEEGDQLQPGEILVTTTTNIGWTPLFPKAAAIITDIGAPLSHAAIVARELGIPAVVGCGNATTRLKTGYQVIVDGGQGQVFLVKEQAGIHS